MNDIDYSKVIIRPPIMMKENSDRPSDYIFTQEERKDITMGWVFASVLGILLLLSLSSTIFLLTQK